jgi:hypothetical protein
MDIAQINSRVDGALRENRRTEYTVIAMALGIFVSGAMVLLLAYWQQNPFVVGGGILLNGLLYWPIREVLKLRRVNVVLQLFPVILGALSPDEAAAEIRKLADQIRGAI